MQKTMFARGGVQRKGFALPTVLISSVILLTMLAVTVGAVNSARIALQGQYYAQLAESAAQSGLEMAEACIEEGYLTWDEPLRPGGDCYGSASVCTADDCYVIRSSDVRTTFEVSAPSIAGDVSTVASKGSSEKVRLSSDAVWKRYNATLRMQDRVTDVNPGAERVWEQVSIGVQHTCGVVADTGTTADVGAYCWGYNQYGELGISAVGYKDTPSPINRGAIPEGHKIVEIATGNDFTCGIASDGKVYCWGLNGSGQLGDGTTTTRTAPVAVSQGALPANVVYEKISAGNAHVCAYASNARAYCWGVNTFGQLGDGTTTTRTAPVAVSQGAIPAGQNFSSVDAGSEHTCAVASNARAYCWGAGDSGRLGTGSTANSLSPAAVAQGAMPAGFLIVQVDAGWGSSCAVASDDKAYCWGYNNTGQLGNGTLTTTTSPVAVSLGAMQASDKVASVTVTASGSSACALTTSGQLFCWGDNAYGQLGDGTDVRRTMPTRVLAGAIPEDETVSTAVINASVACVLSSKMKAYCWGNGDEAQIGNDTFNDSSVPTAVSVVYDKTRWPYFKQISSGLAHTCALASNNQAYCWGSGANGRLGNGTTTDQTTPVAVSQGAIPAGVTLRQIAAGSYHTCALASNNQAYCWGYGAYGQVGNGTTTDQTTPVAVLQGAIPAGATPRQIAAGDSHTCALASNNQTYCWGSGANGRLGNGTTTSQTTPVAVSQGAIPAGVTLRQISAGSSHTCALASNNQTYCWGSGANGRVGNGTTTNQTTPVAVSQGAIPAGATLRQIAAGNSHTCALASNNQAYCWGYGGNGRLGNGTTTDQTTPVAVSQGAIPAGVTLRQISAGSYHTCALASNNQAYCWGSGAGSRLGNGTTTDQTTPVAVSQGAIPAGVTLRQISAGDSHTCALVSNNQAYCWGYGPNGRLGNGTTTSQTTPVAVSQGAIPAGVTLRQISAGSSHTCALASNNQTYCWGSGANGRVGNGTTTNQTTPVAVSQGAIPAGATLRQISAGGNHTCALASNNQAYCWGSGGNGQVGNGTTANQTTPVAVLQGANSSIYVPSYVFLGPRRFF